MICHRCGKPIQPGQKAKTYPKDSASGGGADVIVHERLCTKPPTQTYPSRPSR